jgi:hypothetical protein
VIVKLEMLTGCPEVKAAGVNTKSQLNVPLPDTAPEFSTLKWTVVPWISTILAPVAIPVPLAYMPITKPVALPTVTVSWLAEPVTVVTTAAPAGASIIAVPPEVVTRHQVQVPDNAALVVVMALTVKTPAAAAGAKVAEHGKSQSRLVAAPPVAGWVPS